MIKRFHFNDEYTGPHTGGEYVKYDDYAASERAREEAEAERDRLREKNKVLHRRCQHAEKGVAEKIKEPHRGSFGRGLANAAASMFRARAEEAEARLRAARNEWGFGNDYHGDGDIKLGWPHSDYLSEALSGDLPPCPECAKANAKLAAVGEWRNNSITELPAMEGCPVMWTCEAPDLDRILASDPEVIAVVDGRVTVFSDNGWHEAIVVDHDFGMVSADGSLSAKHDFPVTVTVTRNTKAKEAEHE